MTKFGMSLVFVAASLTIFGGCHIYDEGPDILLVSPEKKLQKSWEYVLRKDFINDIDQYSGFEGWRCIFSEDGEFRKKVFYLSDDNILEEQNVSGKWELIGDNLLLLDEEGVDRRYFTIKRLTHNDLWIEDFFERIELKRAK